MNLGDYKRLKLENKLTYDVFCSIKSQLDKDVNHNLKLDISRVIWEDVGIRIGMNVWDRMVDRSLR